MKSQVHTVSVSLLFLIGLVLMIMAFFWGEPILRSSVETSSSVLAETFLKKLDSEIRSVVSYGGVAELNFEGPGILEVRPEEDLVEIKFRATTEFPENWTYLRNTTSVLRERKDGDMFVIQLFYRDIDIVASGKFALSEGVVTIRRKDGKVELELI